MNAAESEATYRRLADALEERRTALEMRWRDVAVVSGLSLAGLSAIRKGDRKPSMITRKRLEHALQWEPGSINALLEGKEPTEIRSTPPPRPELADPFEVAHLRVPSPDRQDDSDDIDDSTTITTQPGNPYTDPDEAYIWELTEVPENDRREFIGKVRRARLRRRKADVDYDDEV